MRKEEKAQILESIAAQLQETPNFYITDISGLNAGQTSKLRRECFEKGIKLVVVKNTLFHKAVEALGNEEATLVFPALEGPTAIMYCDYRHKLNKKLKQLARFSALSYKAQENAIVMVEPFAMEAPKTKEFLQILANIKAGSRKVLFVLPENSSNIYLSSRNLPEVKVVTVDELNTYTIMNSCSMVLVDGVQDILASRIRR